VRLFDASPLGLAAGSAFTVLLILAAFGDLRTRRIPNKLVASLALLGVAFSIAADPVWAGASKSALGLVTGLLCWLPFYALRWLGAGDVKLFAAASAWLGPLGALEGSIATACAGGVLALVWMVRSRGVAETAEILGMSAGSPSLLTPDANRARRAKLPYGLAIAFGALWAGWLGRMLSP
jgi:prepilin peptidase CpaA